tara:strand:+ start:160 stop:348 length:189 start_codon:yes stop_codon:yes gene_type:complete
MIVFTYLRNPKKIKFKKCRPCVTHKMCKSKFRCCALDFKGEPNELQLWNKEKAKEKRQEKAS